MSKTDHGLSTLGRIRARWGRRHAHEWEDVGYGGAGWFAIRCRTCGRAEIK